jgi:flagellar biosynthesis/type III secretory pathway M-ring protein FliF/YscJ
MEPKNYNASRNWTYTVKQTVTVDWLSLAMIVDPDPYKAAREVIDRIKAL